MSVRPKGGSEDECQTDHEEGLVAGDHPLQHGDDGRALLRPGRALDAELLVRVLLLVEQVGAKDGGQVQRCHLVPCDLRLEKQAARVQTHKS